MSRYFDGTQSAYYLESTTSSAIPSGTDIMTYSAWIYPESWGASSGNGPGYVFFGIGASGVNGGMWVSKSATGGGGSLTGLTSGKLGTTAEAISVDSVLVLNKWQYVTYVQNSIASPAYHNGLPQLYINGVEVSYSTQSSGSAANLTVPLIIGNNATSGTTGGFTGYIDSFAEWAYNVSPQGYLTTAQIIASMAYQGALAVQPNPPNLVNYWPIQGLTSPEPNLAVGQSSVTLTVSNATQGPNSPGQSLVTLTNSPMGYVIFDLDSGGFPINELQIGTLS